MHVQHEVQNGRLVGADCLWQLQQVFRCATEFLGGVIRNRLAGERLTVKMKTHSGAKKRLRLLPGGKVKRKKVGLRHLNSHMSSNVKRQLGKATYVDPANLLQTKRCLVF